MARHVFYRMVRTVLPWSENLQIGNFVVERVSVLVVDVHPFGNFAVVKLPNLLMKMADAAHDMASVRPEVPLI